MDSLPPKVGKVGQEEEGFFDAAFSTPCNDAAAHHPH